MIWTNHHSPVISIAKPQKHLPRHAITQQHRPTPAAGAAGSVMIIDGPSQS